jgi:hypothetical protein
MALRKLGQPWTAADLKKLRAKAKERASARQAAKVLGRTTGAVKFKAMVEGVRFHAIEQPRGVQVKLASRRRRYGMRATLKAVRR